MANVKINKMAEKAEVQFRKKRQVWQEARGLGIGKVLEILVLLFLVSFLLF